MFVDNLTGKQYSFLKFLYERKVPRADVIKHFKGCENDSDLTDSPFNELFYCDCEDNFILTVKGKATFEARRRNNIRFRLPLIISIAAIVISIFSVVVQILKLF